MNDEDVGKFFATSKPRCALAAISALIGAFEPKIPKLAFDGNVNLIRMNEYYICDLWRADVPADRFDLKLSLGDDCPDVLAPTAAGHRARGCCKDES